jgi:hypothetical protein
MSDQNQKLSGRVALWRPRSPETTTVVASGRVDVPADLIAWLAAQPADNHGNVSLGLVLFSNTHRESDRAPTTIGYINPPRGAAGDDSSTEDVF